MATAVPPTPTGALLAAQTDTRAVPLLAPAPTAAHFRNARLVRALTRRMQAAGAEHAGGRAGRLRARALRVPAAAREAWHTYAALGAYARRIDGADARTLVGRSLRLGVRHGIRAPFVYLHRLYRDDRWPVAPLFVQQFEADLMYHASAYLMGQDAVRTLNDKRRFADWAREQGVPTPPVVLAAEAGRVTHGAADGSTLPAEDLFAKWGGRGGGDDTQRYRHAGGAWTDEGGERWTAAALAGMLARRSEEGVVVLQPCLYNHPDVATVSPNALSTLRVVTTRRPGEAPTLVLALLRMGVGRGSADNFGQGGIAAPVDPATGTLRRGLQVAAEQRSYGYDVHPATGAPITGFAVPFWREAVEVALRAHARVGDHVAVGWDVALLADGPVLIEGNWNPGLRLGQLPTGMPLYATALGDNFAHLAEHRLAGASGRELLLWNDWHPLRPSVLGLY